MGFPVRTGRAPYGPDPINSKPVRDPRKALDGETVGRLMFWQLGGVGLTAPQAWFRGTVAAGVLTAGAHAEAFQPRGGTGPTLTRVSTGIYAFTFAAQYPDEQAAQRGLAFDGGIAIAMGATIAHGQVDLGVDLHSGTALFCNFASEPIDPSAFIVVLW